MDQSPAHRHASVHSSAEPMPLGTLMSCGCIVRALLLSCGVCSAELWAGGPTEAGVGEYTHISGMCPHCGAALDQWARVYEQPIPPALRRS